MFLVFPSTFLASLFCLNIIKLKSLSNAMHIDLQKWRFKQIKQYDRV